ncbi:MAG: 50S ribosomal protein L11 methyltransferase [Anaerolineae bacterium]|nr:50S ribosomal protein L11 methyltransferase [Anaerolineae bacterium]
MDITSENAVVSYSPGAEASIAYIPTPLTGHPALMGFHRHLLADTVRTEAFIQAIECVVRPGQVVVDLGSGSGILALACARAGAARVYAIESDSLIFLAQQAAQANGLAERIIFIHQDSRRADLPEKVDVIVSECLGLMGLGGTMVPAVVDLARRYLKPDGRLIPQAITLFIAPVESPLHYEYVHVWEQGRFYGFDLATFQKTASNNLYIARFRPESFLSRPQQVAAVQLLTANVTEVSARLNFAPTRSGRLHGFCGWFEASLADGVTLSASPLAPPTIWRQLYLPLEKELPVATDSLIQLNFGLNLGLRLAGEPGFFRWCTEVTCPSRPAETMSLKQITLKSIPRKVETVHACHSERSEESLKTNSKQNFIEQNYFCDSK